MAEDEMFRDARAWASTHGCLDDFPLEHLEKMEEWSNKIREFIPVASPLLYMLKAKGLEPLLPQLPRLGV